jgi:hypothetical protein
MTDFQKFIKSYKSKNKDIPQTKVINSTKSKKATEGETIQELKELLKPPIKDNSNEVAHIFNNIHVEGFQQQADLLFLPSDYGYKYCLVVVDVASSKCDAEPVKNKTDTTIKKTFKKIYERKILEIPTIIRFDQGSEFKGLVRDYFTEELKVIVKYSLTNRHRQQAQVESKNKQIGNLLTAYQVFEELKTGKINRKWIKQLPEVVKYLNDNLPKRNYHKLSNEIMVSKFSKDLIPLYSTVRRILDYPVDANGKKTDFKFRSADIRWDRQTSKIKRIIFNPNIPPLYILDNKKGVAYTKKQLQVIKEA